MAWTPIADAGVAFSFISNAIAGSLSMTGSTITASAAASPDGGDRLFDLQTPTGIAIRFTIQGFTTANIGAGSIYTPAKFDVDSVEFQVNQAPPYPSGNWGGVTEPQTVWSPNPVEVGVESSGSLVQYFTTFETGDTVSVPETFTMLVEVDVPVVSYNCECDDDYPRKTLLQMRKDLMRRLGFANVDNPAPGQSELLDSFIREAQEIAYRTYRVFRMERYYSWPMSQGVRFYDFDANADTCTKRMDPRMVTWVGISQDDNFWRPLVCGIKPEYYYGDIQGWPQYYEIRQCIEVWPPPSDDTWTLRIKGYFGLMPLEADTDETTIDYQAISLLALANAKAHYGQPDAANYASQYREYIGNLTAGSHHTRRYIPGDDVCPPPPLPVFTGYTGD